MDGSVTKFRSQLPDPPVAREPILGLIEVTRLWLDGLHGARVRADRDAVANGGAAVDELIPVVIAKYSPAFEILARKMLSTATSSGSLAVVEEVVTGLRQDLDRLAWVLTTPVVEAIRAGAGRNPHASVTAAIKRRLRRLRFLAPVDSSVESPPLTGRGLEIWNVLEGRILTAKELSALIDGKPGEDAVRKAIQRIKGSGRQIENVRGRGYYRPDAPPPDMRSAP